MGSFSNPAGVCEEAVQTPSCSSHVAEGTPWFTYCHVPGNGKSFCRRVMTFSLPYCYLCDPYWSYMSVNKTVTSTQETLVPVCVWERLQQYLSTTGKKVLKSWPFWSKWMFFVMDFLRSGFCPPVPLVITGQSKEPRWVLWPQSN